MVWIVWLNLVGFFKAVRPSDRNVSDLSRDLGENNVRAVQRNDGWNNNKETDAVINQNYPIKVWAAVGQKCEL